MIRTPVKMEMGQSGNVEIYDTGGLLLAETFNGSGEMIANAVNSHAELLAALHMLCIEFEAHRHDNWNSYPYNVARAAIQKAESSKI